MEFFKIHDRGKLYKNLCAFFIALIPKKEGTGQLKDFRPIILISSIYKILAKVSGSRGFSRFSQPSHPRLKELLSKVDRFWMVFW